MTAEILANVIRTLAKERWFCGNQFKVNLGKCHLIVCKKTDVIPSTFTCSKLTVETLEQGVKYVQS